MDSFSIIVFLVAFTLHTIHRAYDSLLSPFISDEEAISDVCPLILRIVFMKFPGKVAIENEFLNYYSGTPPRMSTKMKT